MNYLITCRRSALLCVLLLVLVSQGCASIAPDRNDVSGSAASLEDFNPAGLWLYEDRLVTGEVELDDRGNGRYPWEQGYFVTETWSDGKWRGTWHQPGNDREGGFELELATDLEFAFGRWWYTRIGDDNAPPKPGGKFTLTRI